MILSCFDIPFISHLTNIQIAAANREIKVDALRKLPIKFASINLLGY